MDFEKEYITEKHYHKGYVQGVFDLFHVGHLNLLRRAKSCCDYLIVGVVSDEVVESYKNKTPYIPLDERIAIVEAIQYVDEVVVVDWHNMDKIEAWKLYHFDCHFSGDDHTAEWVELERKFKEYGVDMVNFPYTKKRSSTMIQRTLLNEKREKTINTDKMFKTGYLLIDSENGLSVKNYELFKEVKKYCQYLIVGVPADDLMARMHNIPAPAKFSKLKEILTQFSIVDEVVEVNWNNINKLDMWEQIHYDVCFVGGVYGRRFYEDQKELHDKGSELFLLKSVNRENDDTVLAEVLKDASYTKKVVLFGTGKYFDYYMSSFGSVYKPAFAVDNDASKWETKKTGIEICSPDKLKEFSVDDVLVVLCCKNYDDILEQLRKIGNFDFRTMVYKPELALWNEYELILRAEKDYMKESHRQLKILLKEFDRVCTKYNLEYFLICGGLIGAIRHKDLIPWDDDADVAMTRENYEKLKKIAAETWDGSEFTFLPYNKLGNSTFLDFMNRLVYQKETIPTNIFYRVKERMKADVCDHQVLDIYVLDNASDNEKKHKMHCFKQKVLYGLAMGHRGKIDISLYKTLSPFVQLSVWGLSHIGKLLPLSFIFSIYEHHCKKINKEDTHFYYESNGWINFFDHKIPKDLLAETCRLQIGDLSMMSPKRYNDFLENLGYHNYMSYPPACVRKPTHSVKSDIIL